MWKCCAPPALNIKSSARVITLSLPWMKLRFQCQMKKRLACCCSDVLFCSCLRRHLQPKQLLLQGDSSADRGINLCGDNLLQKDSSADRDRQQQGLLHAKCQCVMTLSELRRKSGRVIRKFEIIVAHRFVVWVTPFFSLLA
jgi:hypothetical protein